MSDHRHAHEFLPNKKGQCKMIVGSSICHLPSDAPVHTRFERPGRTDTDRINWIILAEPDIEKTLDDQWLVVAGEEYVGADLRATLDEAMEAEA